MNKRDEVERKYREWLLSYFARGGGDYDFAQTGRDLGFTICGPDEVPMPKEINSDMYASASQHVTGTRGCGFEYPDELYAAYRDMQADYQRERNKE